MGNTLDARAIARLAGLCGVGFLILGSYSVARPPIESLFLDHFGRDGLPTVWMAVAVTALVTVALYNRWAASTELPRLFVGVYVVSVVSLLGLGGLAVVWPAAGYFALYVWKDLYIVFFVEMFWTFANTIFRHNTAQWIYGVFLLTGSLGSLSGNLGVSALVARADVTSSQTLLLLPVILTAGTIGFVILARALADPSQRQPAPTSITLSFSALRGNRYLALMVALICLSQIVITLVDYHYNGVLQEYFPDTDRRTQIIGYVYSAIDVSALVLQVLSGPIVRWGGVGLVLAGIPVVLGLSLGVWVLVPRLMTMVVAKVGSKAFDYSIYRVAKELLYLPLSYREKTEGKALVDILSYRLAKAATSGLLLLLIALSSQSLTTGLTFISIAVWLGITVALVRHYRRRVTS